MRSILAILLLFAASDALAQSNEFFPEPDTAAARRMAAGWKRIRWSVTQYGNASEIYERAYLSPTIYTHTDHYDPLGRLVMEETEQIDRARGDTNRTVNLLRYDSLSHCIERIYMPEDRRMNSIRDYFDERGRISLRKMYTWQALQPVITTYDYIGDSAVVRQYDTTGRALQQYYVKFNAQGKMLSMQTEQPGGGLRFTNQYEYYPDGMRVKRSTINAVPYEFITLYDEQGRPTRHIGGFNGSNDTLIYTEVEDHGTHYMQWETHDVRNYAVTSRMRTAYDAFGNITRTEYYSQQYDSMMRGGGGYYLRLTTVHQAEVLERY